MVRRKILCILQNLGALDLTRKKNSRDITRLKYISPYTANTESINILTIPNLREVLV